MPQVDVQDRSVSVRFGRSDINIGSRIRVDICDVVFPHNYHSGSYGSIVDGASIGNIEFSLAQRIDNFEIYIDETSVKNASVFKVEPTFVDNTFRPCNLDRDKNGIITQRDIDRTYDIYEGTTNANFDIDNSGLVTQNDRALASQYLGYICSEDPPVDPTTIDNPLFSINAKDFINGTNGKWELGLVEDYNVYQYNQEPLEAMNFWRSTFLRDDYVYQNYIRYCFDNGFIDSIEDYYDPSLPLGSPFIDTASFDDAVFDYNSARQYYRPGTYNSNINMPEVRYNHDYTPLNRPIDNEFSVSFWWYWDSSMVPDGYVWRDVYSNGYGANSGPLEAWTGTAKYISVDYQNPNNEILNLGRTSSQTLWNISGLVSGYALNEIMDLDAYVQIQGPASLGYHINTEYPDRIANAVMMRYDHQYSRLWFTGAMSGANTGTTNSDYAQVGTINIPPEVFWEEDKWHNLIVTKKKNEAALCYLDGALVQSNEGRFYPATPIGYYHTARLGPLMTKSGEYVYRYPEDLDFIGSQVDDVFIGGPANYVANFNRGPGHWYPAGNTYDQVGSAQFYGQNSGNFIGKTNAFKVWDKVLTAEQVSIIYNLGIAAGVPT